MPVRFPDRHSLSIYVLSEFGAYVFGCGGELVADDLFCYAEPGGDFGWPKVLLPVHFEYLALAWREAFLGFPYCFDISVVVDSGLFAFGHRFGEFEVVAEQGIAELLAEFPDYLVVGNGEDVGPGVTGVVQPHPRAPEPYEGILDNLGRNRVRLDVTVGKTVQFGGQLLVERPEGLPVPRLYTFYDSRIIHDSDGVAQR